MMSNVSGFCQNCISLFAIPPNHESSHSLRAAELLCGNDPPLLSELAVFKYDVTKWESIVAELHQKIAQVQAFLDPLVAARIDAEARLKDAKSLLEVLRPICHLPNEILIQIFRFFIPRRFPNSATKYDALDSRALPWTLTHVCQRWRNLALSLPSLWSCMKVDFAGNRPITRLQVKTLVDLSRDVPISVDITSKEALEVLRDSEHRWKFLRSSLGKDDYRRLQRTSFPALETLDHSRIRAAAGPPIDIFNARTAPNLRTLVASYTVLLHLDLPWTQLTRLILRGEFQAPLLPFIERMTGLERVKFIAASSAEVSAPIMLPRVSYLSLAEPAQAPTGRSKNLLEHMVLPMLSNLHLSFKEPIPAAPRDTYYPSTLDSAAHLTTLRIDVEMSNPVTNAQLLLDFLWLTPHVKQFTLRYSYLTESFVLGMTSAAGKPCRLPEMTSFDIGSDGVESRSFGPDANPTELICRMIESRMAPSGDTNAFQASGAVLQEVCVSRWMYREAMIWSSERWASIRSAMKIFCDVDPLDID